MIPDPNSLYITAVIAFQSGSSSWPEDLKSAYRASLIYDFSHIDLSSFVRVIRIIDYKCGDVARKGEDFVLPTDLVARVLDSEPKVLPKE